MDDQAPEPQPTPETAAAQKEPAADPAAVFEEVQTEVTEDRSDKPTKRRSRWKDGGLTRGMEVAVVLATVVNAGVALVQWRAMEKSNALSSKAITAAETANQIARDTLIQSKAQAEIDRRETAKEAVASREESRAAATANLNMAQQTLEVSQRAQLGFEPSMRNWMPDPASARRLTLSLFNSGDTPAHSVRIIAGWALRQRENPLKEGFPIRRQGNVPLSNTVILGEGGVEVPTIDGPRFTEEDIQKLRAGQLLLYVFGSANYRDIFGHQRAVRFCAIYEPETFTWGLCPHDNWAD